MLSKDTGVSVIIIDKVAMASEGIDVSHLERSWFERHLDQNVYRVFTKFQ